jgi:DNA-binding XRE family transcriptional regulator
MRDNPNMHLSPGVAGMNPRTLEDMRAKLRFQIPDLDAALNLPAGTVDAAIAGTTPLTPPVVMRLRDLIRTAEGAGVIPDRPHVGMLIRAARVSKGLSQQVVADRAGMTASRYCRVESARQPSFHTTIRVANALGVEVDWILWGKVGSTHSSGCGIMSEDSTDSPSQGEVTDG